MEQAYLMGLKTLCAQGEIFMKQGNDIFVSFRGSLDPDYIESRSKKEGLVSNEG